MAVRIYRASGMGTKSPVQPFLPAICKKIPSEPLMGRPRSARLYNDKLVITLRLIYLDKPVLGATEG